VHAGSRMETRQRLLTLFLSTLIFTFITMKVKMSVERKIH
jgi:hypothetical protein